VELFLRGLDEDSRAESNLFLDVLLGAALHPMTAEQYADRDAHMSRRAEELGAEGRRAFVIPEGGSNALGSMGYVRCMREIVEQQGESGIAFEHLVCATGSGGTLAGLIAGAESCGFEGRIWGVPISGDSESAAACINRVLEEMQNSHLPELARRVKPGDLLEGHVGPGYAQATDEDLERIRDMAILTGLILDPVYTNKAFGGLLRLIREKTAAPDSSILFMHTGGIFGLFPFAERMEPLL
jgi:D-cysteine desulfhydrase